MKTFIFILATSAIFAPALAQTTVAANCNTATAVGCLACYLAAGGTTATSTDCRQAKAGYFLTFASGVGTVAICGDNSGRAADSADQTVTQTCTATPAGTTTGCNVYGATATTCINCKAGYHLSAANVCTWCPTGRGKAKDTTVPTPTATGAENTACATVCATASDCLACGATGTEAVCLACASGKSLNSAMACVAATTTNTTNTTT